MQHLDFDQPPYPRHFYPPVYVFFPPFYSS